MSDRLFAHVRRFMAAVTLAGFGLFAPALARAQETGIAVGATAPAALVETPEGAKVDLGKYVGKTPVVFQFWAVWCSNCKALEPQMRAAQTKYGKRVRFVGVAVGVNQSAALARRYATKHQLPFEVLYDKTGDAAEKYDVPATSYIVVVNRAGKVVYTGVGADQNIDAAVRKAL
ncbi:MAG TPA: TlpA disulfide reductase family protein [Gemmatimonadaceae bacterium]|nr:TlpA disulfide reductase family protein [Gemmatimonadaceae bacterium]